MDKINYTRVERAEAFFAAREMEKLSHEFEKKLFELENFVNTGQSVATYLEEKSMKFNGRYREAYVMYESVIWDARNYAKKMQEFTDYILGIAIGVAVGMGVGVLAGVLVGGVLKTVGKKFAELFIAALSEELEPSGSSMAKKIYPILEFSQAGQDLMPSGVHPNLQESRIWKALFGFRRDIGIICNSHRFLGRAGIYTERLKAQLDLIGRGLPAKKPLSELISYKYQLLAYKKELDAINLPKLTDEIEERYAKAYEYIIPGTMKIEQDIWLCWLSSLETVPEVSLLDLNPIEDRLREIGVLGTGSRLRYDLKPYIIWRPAFVDELYVVRLARIEVDKIRIIYELIDKT